jgi:hypothetical protein
MSIEREIDAILEENPPRRIRADTLARHLHVSDAERTLLRVYTIGAYDVPKAERIKRRKERARLRAQARRRANGVKPREQYLAEARARAEQRQKEGVSRATWYRRRAVRQVRAHDSSLSHAHGPVSLSAACGKNSPRNGNGKSNGKHGARRGRGLPTKEGTSEQPLATATPRPSRDVHDLTAVGIG